MDLDSNILSVFKMWYHLVLVVKYRCSLIRCNQQLKKLFEYISPGFKITLSSGINMDHVHILFRAQTKTEISKFINACKRARMRILKKEFPQIHKSLWKEYFWIPSFCSLTAGGAPIEVIKRYIKSP
ncbi:MAG: IS200/IS605 family transposase [Christensenellaceae bacterium]|nr:IS200/IS605 family transposase [Christensenellaceae bacterium]